MSSQGTKCGVAVQRAQPWKGSGGAKAIIELMDAVDKYVPMAAAETST